MSDDNSIQALRQHIEVAQQMLENGRHKVICSRTRVSHPLIVGDKVALPYVDPHDWFGGIVSKIEKTQITVKCQDGDVWIGDESEIFCSDITITCPDCAKQLVLDPDIEKPLKQTINFTCCVCSSRTRVKINPPIVETVKVLDGKWKGMTGTVTDTSLARGWKRVRLSSGDDASFRAKSLRTVPN